jgi:hypothetical protein
MTAASASTKRPQSRTAMAALAVAFLALTAAGCGLADPYTQPHTPHLTAHSPTTVPTDPTRPPLRCAAWTPRCVAALFAAAQGTYTPRGYPRQHARMVSLSVGALRRQLTRTPARVIAAGLRHNNTHARAGVLATTTERRSRSSAVVVVAVRQLLRSGSEPGEPAPEYLYFRAVVRGRPAGWRVAAFQALR